MGYDYLSGWLAGVNADEEAVFSWGYPGPDRSGFEERKRRAARFSPVDAERALTLLCGELAGLKVDREIFRGRLPVGEDSGFALSVTGAPEPRTVDYREYYVEFSGRALSRDRCYETVSLLTAKLPLPAWVGIGSKRISGNVTVAELKVRHELRFEFDRSHRGAFIASVFLPLTARICITPPRGIAATESR